MRAKSSLWLVAIVGVTLGAALGGYVFAPAPEISPPEDAFAGLRLHLDTHRVPQDVLGDGWRRPEEWGAQMKRERAWLQLFVDGEARSDIELILDGRADFKAEGAAVSVRVLFNGFDVGMWPLSPKRRFSQRRFIIPRAAFNFKSPADLLLMIEPEGAPIAFGLRELSLEDARTLSDFKGTLESCNGQKLRGWAVAGDLNVPVTVSVDGEPVAGRYLAVERPDLEKHGLPADAGFEIMLADTIAAGREIAVSFYPGNGQTLRNSPCRS